MNKSIKFKRFIPAGEAAEYLEVSHSALRQWCLDGRIKFWTTPGGHRRILRSELDRFVEDQKEMHD